MPLETQNNNENAENSENQNLNLSTSQNSNHNKKNVLIFAFIFVLVIIGIYFSYRFLNTQMFPYSSQEAPQVIQEKDEMLNWKTYRNEEYSFEFKYPNHMVKMVLNDEELDYLTKVEKNFEETFQVTLNELLRMFSENQQSGFTVDIMNGKSLNEFMSFESKKELWDTYFHDRSPPKIVRNFIISNKNGVLRDGPGELSKYDTYQILIENTDTQIIRLTFYSTQNWGDSMKLVDQILSTFKFTPPSTPVQ